MRPPEEGVSFYHFLRQLDLAAVLVCTHTEHSAPMCHAPAPVSELKDVWVVHGNMVHD